MTIVGSSSNVESAGNAAGRATKERLLLVAEQLFADRGVDSVSLAEIGQAAEQRNTRVIGYHFGDRQGLLHAILEFRAEQVNRRRAELVGKVVATTAIHQPERLRALVEAFTLAMAEQSEIGSFLGLAARLQTDFGRWDGYLTVTRSEEFADFTDLLRLELPHLSRRGFSSRLDAVATMQLHLLATRERRERNRHAEYELPRPQWLEQVINIELSAFLAPGP